MKKKNSQESEVFIGKLPKNNFRKEIFRFSVITSLLISIISFYTYVQSAPLDISKYPTIRIQTEGTLSYDKYTNSTFELESKDKYDIIEPLNSKLRLRGSGTGWNKLSPKKGYRIELSEPKSILGMDEDDDWLLFEMYYDYSRMRLKLAFDLWRTLLITNPTAILPQSEYVCLYLNGEFQGIYLLTQKNNRKLFQLDDAQNNVNSSLIFQTKFNTDLRTYNNDVWEQDWPNDYEGIYIMDSVLAELIFFITSTSNETFFDPKKGIYSKFDKLNLIDFYIFNFFILHQDFWSKNYFLVRNTLPNKFYLIPWDFDECFGKFGWNKHDPETNPELDIYSLNYLYYRLLSNKAFRKDCSSRWNDLRENLWTEKSIIDRLVHIYEEFEELIEYDTQKYKYTAVYPQAYNEGWDDDFYEDYKDLIDWISKRLEFCDIYFASN